MPRHQVFEEGAKVDDDVEIVTGSEEAGQPLEASSSETKGALVKEILEAERALKGKEQRGEHEVEPGPQGIVLQRRKRHGDDAGRRGNLDRTREMVQKMCQSATPLGRCLEFLQEDAEAMDRELKFWGAERRLYEDKLAQAESSVEGFEALQSQIQEVEDQISQTNNRILGLKAQVLNNHEAIINFLTMVSSKTN